MSNVINFPTTGVTAAKSFCKCGNGLEYWVGNDGNAYGICPHCNIGMPCEIEIFEEEDYE